MISGTTSKTFHWFAVLAIGVLLPAESFAGSKYVFPLSFALAQVSASFVDKESCLRVPGGFALPAALAFAASFESFEEAPCLTDGLASETSEFTLVEAIGCKDVL